MSISSFKVLWFLLSWMSNLLEAIYYFGLEFRENFFHFIKTICLTESAVDCSDVRPRIDAHIREMKKLPKHLAVILTVKNKKDVDLAQLSNLVRWALNSGVHFISFYDFKGKQHNNRAYKQRDQTPHLKLFRRFPRLQTGSHDECSLIIH